MVGKPPHKESFIPSTEAPQTITSLQLRTLFNLRAEIDKARQYLYLLHDLCLTAQASFFLNQPELETALPPEIIAVLGDTSQEYQAFIATTDSFVRLAIGNKTDRVSLIDLVIYFTAPNELSDVIIFAKDNQNPRWQEIANLLQAFPSLKHILAANLLDFVTSCIRNSPSSEQEIFS